MVVADVVVPTPDYVRFATHYRFRPDFCHAKDPQSKGIVENLVGYANDDLMVPLGVLTGEVTDLDVANTAAAAWWAQVNNRRNCEIAAVPIQRLAVTEAGLLAALPSLLPWRVVRRPARALQGRQALLRPVRLGALLGAEPAARSHRRGPRRTRGHHHRRCWHGRGPGRAPADGTR